MKKIIALVLGLAMATSVSMSVCAETTKGNPNPTTYIMPRMGYEVKTRTIASKSSWTSSKYYCVPGQYFGGGHDNPVSLTGKVQFCTTTDGPWQTLSTKTLKANAMDVEVSKKGYYRFVLTNNSSSSVTVDSYVIVDN